MHNDLKTNKNPTELTRTYANDSKHEYTHKHNLKICKAKLTDIKEKTLLHRVRSYYISQ